MCGNHVVGLLLGARERIRDVVAYERHEAVPMISCE